MENHIYKITLADGTVIDNLRLNGNNFISEVPVDSAVFEGNCSPVVISDGENNEFHSNMELVQVTHPSLGGYWIVLRDLSSTELKEMEMQANIEYLAMMTGVEL